MKTTSKATNAPSSNPTGFIRSLGAFEEIYWLYTQTGPRGFAYAAEIEGRTTVDAWRKAIDHLNYYARQRTCERAAKSSGDTSLFLEKNPIFYVFETMHFFGIGLDRTRSILVSRSLLS
jgi:hypothetical protein